MLLENREYTVEELVGLIREESANYFSRNKTTIKGPKDIQEYLAAILFDRNKEQVSAVFLDNLHNVITFRVINDGDLTSSPVYVRKIIEYMVELKATAIVMCHNHPTGSADISNDDIQITRKVQTAVEAIEGRLLDHVVLTSEGLTSLKELGHLK